MKVKFTKTALESLEDIMNVDEIQDFINELEKKLEDGSFFLESERIAMDELKEEDPELYDRLNKAFDEDVIKDEELN